MGKCDSFGFVIKILIIPKMMEMGHFFPKTLDLLKICSLDFSEIIPDDRHLKLAFDF